VLDDRIYFGAAFDKRQPPIADDEEEDEDDDTTTSFHDDDVVEDADDGDEELEPMHDSQTLYDSSPDISSLFISSTTTGTPQKTPKKTHMAAVNLNRCRINQQLSDLDRDIIAPDVFLHNGRKAAAVTIWIPNHYTEADVTAVVNDGGYTVTLEFTAPQIFLTTVNQAATSDATVGSSLGEAYATFIQNLPLVSRKKLIIDLPFKAEERLCPEVLGKSSYAEGLDIVDVDLGRGNNGRQIIFAVREVLRDDLKRESVGRRVFRGTTNGGQHQNYTNQQEQQNRATNQQQEQHTTYQQHNNEQHDRSRVRRHDEIGIVGDYEIDSNL
jgi:hypothetical protein